MLRHQLLQIGRWQVHDDARVSSGDESHRLTPKAFDLLAYLAERPNRLVSNNEIVAALWSHEVVSDASVYNLVSELRRALGDNSRAPVYIKTVSRRGYMLVAEVSVQPAPAAVEMKPSTSLDRPRIAVLPFTNLSSDPNQAYFSEGISEDILDALARNVDLTVRAWQSSFLFKTGATHIGDIAERLEASHLVSGSVRKEGSQIRVSARLTDVAANADVWSARYDRELTDIFTVQDDITRAIVDALGLHFSAQGSESRTANVAAYDAYLSGRYHQGRFEIEEAIECYTRATELDSDYADAYARLGQIYATLVWLSPPNFDELFAREQELVAKALALDQHQYLALGLKASHLPAQEAIYQLDHLMRRYPNDPDLLKFYSFVLRRIGRFDLVAQIADRMVELDPLSPDNIYDRAWHNISVGRTREAKADADRCEQLGRPAAVLRTQIALLERDFDVVNAQCERTDWRFGMPNWRPLHAALGAYLEGDRERVAGILDSVEEENEVLTGYACFIKALLRDDLKAAATYLEAAIERGEPFPLYVIQGDAVSRLLFPDFYASARYKALLEKLELDPDSVARLSIPPLPFAPSS